MLPEARAAGTVLTATVAIPTLKLLHVLELLQTSITSTSTRLPKRFSLMEKMKRLRQVKRRYLLGSVKKGNYAALDPAMSKDTGNRRALSKPLRLSTATPTDVPNSLLLTSPSFPAQRDQRRPINPNPTMDQLLTLLWEVTILPTIILSLTDLALGN